MYCRLPECYCAKYRARSERTCALYCICHHLQHSRFHNADDLRPAVQPKQSPRKSVRKAGPVSSESFWLPHPWLFNPGTAGLALSFAARVRNRQAWRESGELAGANLSARQPGTSDLSTADDKLYHTPSKHTMCRSWSERWMRRGGS